MHSLTPRTRPAPSARPSSASTTRWLRALCWLALGVACGGASEEPTSPSGIPSPEFEGPPFFEGVDSPASEDSGGQASSGGGLEGLVEPPSSGTANIPDTCVRSTAPAELVRQPVDIILALDNSGSMSDELEAVEANINLNFASILALSGVDYRVILVSRHREEPRDESDEASTSICVSSPLSGLADCEEAPEPVFSERFYQYSTKIESDDSFDVLLDTYAPPFDGDDREEDYDKAPLGWSAWLRPGAKKVFLEMTDDDEDMAPEDFVSQLVALAPEHFGSDPAAPSFVFHSIVGLAEKSAPTDAYLPDEPVQEETCTGNDNEVENAGQSYQKLSTLTGGLRFPLCQFGAYDVVFQRIAEDVVLSRGVACDFDIPDDPAGMSLVLSNVAIEYTRGDVAAAPLQFGQAQNLDECQGYAFYIDGGRLYLCPDTCAAIRSDRAASVTVLFTCESQLIVPR